MKFLAYFTGVWHIITLAKTKQNKQTNKKIAFISNLLG